MSIYAVIMLFIFFKICCMAEAEKKIPFYSGSKAALGSY